MTKDELVERLKANEGEFLKFDRIENPLHQRPDICAFLRLHELVPGTRDMVSAAEHDEIYLDVNLLQLAAVATEADVVYLQRCGVRVDDYEEGLAMFT